MFTKWLLFGTVVAGSFAFAYSAYGQSLLADNLEEVRPELKPLDKSIREQLIKWFEEREVAIDKYGVNCSEYHNALQLHDPISVHGNSIIEYAREHSGSPASLTCLSYIIDWGEGLQENMFRSACAELAAHHKNNAALSWLCSRCTNWIQLNEKEKFLNQLYRSSENATVQAGAAYNLAVLYDSASKCRIKIEMVRNLQVENGNTRVVEHLDVLRDRSNSELETLRDEFLKLVIERYAKEKPWVMKGMSGRLSYTFLEDPTQEAYGQLARRLAYEVKNLRIGCPAPDFTAIDVSGNKFRLSGNPGKPTLLMFSFNGCVPCKALYPAIRKVEERFAPMGLSVVGVMSDRTVDTVQEAIDSGDITWRCTWDGVAGPITKKYAVKSYPTMYLVDGHGRISATTTSLNDGNRLIASVNAAFESISTK